MKTKQEIIDILKDKSPKAYFATHIKHNTKDFDYSKIGKIIFEDKNWIILDNIDALMSWTFVDKPKNQEYYFFERGDYCRLVPYKELINDEEFFTSAFNPRYYMDYNIENVDKLSPLTMLTNEEFLEDISICPEFISCLSIFSSPEDIVTKYNQKALADFILYKYTNDSNYRKAHTISIINEIVEFSISKDWDFDDLYRFEIFQDLDDKIFLELIKFQIKDRHNAHINLKKIIKFLEREGGNYSNKFRDAIFNQLIETKAPTSLLEYFDDLTWYEDTFHYMTPEEIQNFIEYVKVYKNFDTEILEAFINKAKLTKEQKELIKSYLFV